MVREQVQRFGLASCRGESGGAKTLRLVAQNGHEALVSNAGGERLSRAHGRVGVTLAASA